MSSLRLIPHVVGDLLNDPRSRFAGAGLGSSILFFTTSVIAARLLGPDGRGKIALIYALNDVSNVVFALGLNYALGFAYVSNRASIPQIAGFLLRYAVVASPLALFSGVMATRLPGLSELSSSSRFVIIVAVGVSPAVITPGLVALQLLIADDRLTVAAAYSIMPATIYSLSVGILAVFRAITVTTVAAASVAASGAAQVFAVRKARLRPAGSTRPRPILLFGLQAFPSSLASFVSNRSDQLIIGPIVGTSSLGEYAIAVSASALPAVVGQAVGARVYRGVGAATAPGARWTTTCHYVVRSAFSAAAFAVVMAVVAPTLVPLVFGASFAPATKPLLILLPGAIATCVYVVANQAANAAGHPRVGTYSEMVALALTLGCVYPAARYGGISGAAALSTIAYTSRAASCLFLLRRRLNPSVVVVGDGKSGLD